MGALVNINSSIQTLDDLNNSNVTIAVQRGGTPHTFSEKYLTNAKVNTFDNRAVATTEVAQGKADAAIYLQHDAYNYQKQYPNTTRWIKLDIQDPDMLDDLGINWGFAINKNNTNLVIQVNEFLSNFKAEGGYEKLVNKHLTNEKAEFDEAGIDFFF